MMTMVKLALTIMAVFATRCILSCNKGSPDLSTMANPNFIHNLIHRYKYCITPEGKCKCTEMSSPCPSIPNDGYLYNPFAGYSNLNITECRQNCEGEIISGFTYNYPDGSPSWQPCKCSVTSTTISRFSIWRPTNTMSECLSSCTSGQRKYICFAEGNAFRICMNTRKWAGICSAFNEMPDESTCTSVANETNMNSISVRGLFKICSSLSSGYCSCSHKDAVCEGDSIKLQDARGFYGFYECSVTCLPDTKRLLCSLDHQVRTVFCINPDRFNYCPFQPAELLGISSIASEADCLSKASYISSASFICYGGSSFCNCGTSYYDTKARNPGCNVPLGLTLLPGQCNDICSEPNRSYACTYSRGCVCISQSRFNQLGSTCKSGSGDQGSQEDCVSYCSDFVSTFGR